MTVRPSAVAGQWYPGTRDALLREVDAHLASAGRDETGCPRALIAPHAGLVYSGPVAASAYALVGECRYAAVVLVGPSHFVGFEGVSIWPRGEWQTPLGAVAVADRIAAAIAAESAGIIEFPNKSDPMVRELLRARPDIFPDYVEEAFLAHVAARAAIIEQVRLGSDGRLIVAYRKN